jgi:hypothetical protein
MKFALRYSSGSRDACPVVQGDRSVNGAEALRVLRETMGVVQKLYPLSKP